MLHTTQVHVQYVYTYCKTLSRTRRATSNLLSTYLFPYTATHSTHVYVYSTTYSTFVQEKCTFVRASTRARNAYVYSTRIHATQYTATHSVVLSYFRGTRLQLHCCNSTQQGITYKKIDTTRTSTVSKYCTCTRLPKKKVNK